MAGAGALATCECENDDHREFNNNTPNNERDDFCAAVTLTCEGGDVNETNDGCVCTDSNHRLFTQDTTSAEDDVCAAEVACGGGTVNNKNQCICPTAGHLAGDDGICSLPQNGNECRELAPGTVYDPTASSCASGCGNGRTADMDSNFNCRLLVAADCATQENIDAGTAYFDADTDGTKGYVECRAPVTGEECRMRQGADAGSTEVYESETGMCQDSCQGARVEDDAHTCRDHGQDLCTPTEQIADGGACREPRNGTECGTATGGARGFYNPRSAAPGDGDCVASCQGGGLDREVGNNNDCRDRELMDCENNEYLDAADLTCKSPTNGAQCRMRKEVEADPANMDVLDGTACRSSCTFDRRADGDGICQDPTEEQCAESDRYPDGSNCVPPTTGSQCAIALDDPTMNFYDTNRGGCTDSCSASREPRTANVCEDRQASDCMNDNDYIDETAGQDRACTPAMTGAQCRIAKAPVSETAVFEDGACATDCRTGTNRQPALETFNCRIPTADDCRDLGQVPSGGDNCRDPMDGGECQGVFGNERRFFENGSCVEQCSATHEPRDQNACTPRDLDDCMDDHYLDATNNNVCTRATNGLQCRDARNSPSTTSAVFEADGEVGCATECNTGRTAPPPNYICRPTGLIDCMDGHYLNDDNECQAAADGNDCQNARGFTTGAVFEDGACATGCRTGTDRQPDMDRICRAPSQEHCGDTDEIAVGDMCVAPEDGEDCRVLTPGTFYDPDNMMCEPNCGDGRIGPGPRYDCRDLMASDCTEAPRTYFDDDADGMRGYPECRAPSSGIECRNRQDAPANSTEVYESLSSSCEDDCQGDRVPNDITHTCENPGQDACTDLMMIAEAGSGTCRAPRNGDECGIATRNALNFYNPRSATPGDGDCVASCQGGGLDREVTDMNSNCRDRELRDCEDNEYLDAADLTCKAPTNGEQCRNRKEAASDPNNMDVLDGTACVNECSLDRREDANGICQDPTEAQCAETDMYPSGGNCVPPTTGTQCAIALDDSTMGFYNLETSSCTTACLPIQETRTDNVCENRDRDDCDDGEYFNPPDRTCIAPTNGVQCREARNGLGGNAVFENDGCATMCDNDRQENTVFTCENPTEDYCADRNQVVNGESCEDPDTGAECHTAYEGTRNVYDADEGCLFECRAPRERRDRGICTDRTAEDCMEDGLYVNVSNDRACEMPTNGAECRMTKVPVSATAVYENERCAAGCNGDRVPDAEFTCQDPTECPGMNQVPDADGMCDCISGYADSDTSTPELTCTQTPTCDGANQDLDTTRNRCDCERDYVDLDDATPLECVRECVDPEERQPDGSCLAPTISLSNCTDAQKFLAGACITLTASDCLPAEKFDDDRCVLLAPGDWTGSPPPYGAYEHGDCTEANWPWSIVQTADGLSEICHAPVNLLATEVPSSQTLNNAGEQLDFCVLRGAESGDSVRCDDPTVFGNLGIPDAPEGLVTQTTATITITLSDGAIREATTVTAAVARYLQVVHVSGSVAAIFPPDTAASEITMANPLVGTISLEMPDPGTMSVTPPPGTNTMTPPATNTVTPPAAGGGGGGGGGGGAAAALIAVPVVLLGGYWLLGGFDYIDPIHNLNYSGENSDFTYRGDAGFELNHGSLHSFAQAIQSDGEAVAYQSGISYGADLYSLNYAAYESKSVYDYDLSARLNYGEGTWSISPTADAEFHYSANTEDWTAEVGAGLTADWNSHKWNIRAHSAFTGDLNHGLDVEYKF